MSNKDKLIKELIEKHNEVVLKAFSTFDPDNRRQVIPDSLYNYTEMVLQGIEKIVKY